MKPWAIRTSKAYHALLEKTCKTESSRLFFGSIFLPTLIKKARTIEVAQNATKIRYHTLTKNW